MPAHIAIPLFFPEKFQQLPLEIPERTRNYDSENLNFIDYSKIPTQSKGEISPTSIFPRQISATSPRNSRVRQKL
ncbi:hypothetical protein [Dapis sp. BLCC M229]|uniref:hypothetical protein n=1 Tax=Dapis sp. BLCC M229 TaxID=3400188 RepID=UPI003CEEC8B3